MQGADVTPIVQGLFDDWNGIPFPQFFGQKEAYTTIGFWDKVIWNLMAFGSLVWGVSGLNSWGVLFELFGGDYAKLGFLDKCIWIYYRIYSLNYDMGVFHRNVSFLFWKDLAAAASALWFLVLFPWNFFLRLTADELTYDHDFDEIDANGYDYSLTQATSFHYWEGKESHGLFSMLWTNYVTDTLQVIFFGLPLLVIGPAFFIFQFVYVLSLPLIWTI